MDLAVVACRASCLRESLSCRLHHFIAYTDQATLLYVDVEFSVTLTGGAVRLSRRLGPV